MASKSKRARLAPHRDLKKTFAYWATAVFLIKLIIILNITEGAWIGADGENYLKGVEGLLNAGIYSKESTLNYWPAGYPLIIYLLSFFGKSWVLATLSILQSAIFSFAVYFFAKQLSRTRLKNYSYFSLILILFNPTLSLSSVVIGYESLAASGSLLVTGIMIKDLIENQESRFLVNLVYTSAILGILTFMQPRLIVGSIVIIFIWIFTRKPIKAAALFSIVSLLVLFFFPATLIYRNLKSTGVATISTNLGVTMNIGAGDGASGGYDSKKQGVICDITTTDIGKADSERVACVVKWYVNNPSQVPRLFFNKSIYFWSPWSGPMLSGTMNRNPWSKINPIKSMEKNSEGIKLLLSPFGKLVAWVWLLSGVFLLFYGFYVLWKAKFTERIIGVVALVVILASWAVTLISIGDHRFRLPIMGMSLFLQAIGLKTLSKGGKAQMLEGPALR
jgi:hypothetical protein